MKDKNLALAGVFQATELVRQAACHGTWSGYAATACLNSLFIMESESVADIYGGSRRVHLGFETLLAVLQGDNDYADSLRYAVGLIQLQKRFSRSRSLQSSVGETLATISGEGHDLAQHEREDRQAHEIAGLYARTVSNLDPRIIVSGKPQYLQNERTTDWIRTLLLAGIRSATLWRQLGAGRFDLMFGRKKIIADVQDYLTG